MAFNSNAAAQHQRAKRIILFALLFCASLSAASQTTSDSTISVTPFQSQLTANLQPPSDRFVASHGRQGFIAGYASTGLEAWVYPFQIFKNYRLFFRRPGSDQKGSTESIDGQTLISKIEYRPGSITRIYNGTDFTVREKLFVPLDSPGGIITYSVQSKTPLQIELHLTPVIGLMWPAEHTLSSANWDSSTKSLTLFDFIHSYHALISSPQAIAQSWLVDARLTPLTDHELLLTLTPDSSGTASLAWSLSPLLYEAITNDPVVNKRKKSNAQPAQVDDSSDVTVVSLLADTKHLIEDHLALEAASVAYYQTALDSEIEIQTPDPAVNQAILWSELALDQAWACNPDLGCGYLAGYGPSRIERRPQYAWFFAGDGIVSAEGALSAGDTKHAREELEFILLYQDKKSGMIWHELTQSAHLIDWANKYPYFYAHVDTTLQFLSFVARYVEESGDVDFLHHHWPAIQLAYHYATSLIDPQTGLPTIPAGKEGGNEQTRMTDDLGLSASWIDASASFSSLANLMGDQAAAEVAAAASLRVRKKIQPLYWNSTNSFWSSGHTINGQTFEEQHSGPSSALDLHLFTPDAEEKILNRIASPDFLTPWGIRSVAVNSPGYSPTSYAQGSVWPVNTAAWAQTFFAAHRSATAYSLWHSLIPLSTFDSAGHIHEVFQGDASIPQSQSVPEQSWSSAAFLTATIHGLLGINVDALHNQLTFAPHLPADWPTLTLRHLTLGAHQLNLQLTRTPNTLLLKIDNPGSVFHLHYNPELPLHAHNLTATQNQTPVQCNVENFHQSTIAHLSLEIPAGTTEIQIQFTPQK